MKKNKIIFWTGTIIIALMEAVMPVTTWILAPEYMTFGTKALGYPDYFAYALVIAKVVGVVAIIYPKIPNTIKEWAYAGLTFTLVFAFISHACVDKNIGYMIMPLAFLGILAVSYIYKDKIKKTMAKTDYQTIDQYHEVFSGETLLRMQTIRTIINDIVPEAEECISYQIPCFKYEGYLIYYAAYPKHISLANPWSADFLENFKKDLDVYKMSKAIIQFPKDKPLPEKLIEKIVVFRKKENEAQLKAKKQTNAELKFKRGL